GGERDRHHPAAARVTPGSAVRPELGDVGDRELQAGLLGELAYGGVRQILVGLDEATGQCPAAGIRRATTTYQQHLPAGGECNHVDSDQERLHRTSSDGQGRHCPALTGSRGRAHSRATGSDSTLVPWTTRAIDPTPSRPAAPSPASRPPPRPPPRPATRPATGSGTGRGAGAPSPPPPWSPSSSAEPVAPRSRSLRATTITGVRRGAVSRPLATDRATAPASPVVATRARRPTMAGSTPRRRRAPRSRTAREPRTPRELTASAQAASTHRAHNGRHDRADPDPPRRQPGAGAGRRRRD